MNPLLLAGVGATAAWTMRQRFDNRIVRDLRALGSKKPIPMDLDALPAPVRRFARRAQAEWPAAPAVVRIAQHGRLRRRQGDAWSPYDGTAHVAVGHTGLSWHARVSRLGWVAVHEAEALVFGRARGESRLLGALPTGSESGANALRAQRLAYLAWLPWVPHAAWCNPELRWTAGEDGTLRVTLEGDDALGLDVEIDDEGDVSGLRGTVPRLEATGWRDRAWSMECGDHASVDGLRVPRHAEARWEGDSPFVHRRAHVTAVADVVVR